MCGAGITEWNIVRGWFLTGTGFFAGRSWHVCPPRPPSRGGGRMGQEHTFTNFVASMTPRPTPHITISCTDSSATSSTCAMAPFHCTPPGLALQCSPAPREGPTEVMQRCGHEAEARAEGVAEGRGDWQTPSVEGRGGGREAEEAVGDAEAEVCRKSPPRCPPPAGLSGRQNQKRLPHALIPLQHRQISVCCRLSPRSPRQSVTAVGPVSVDCPVASAAARDSCRSQGGPERQKRNTAATAAGDRRTGVGGPYISVGYAPIAVG